MESRKSPKTSRTSQEGLRSPRLPTKKPLIRSPSLTRREMSMDGISEVLSEYVLCGKFIVILLAETAVFARLVSILPLPQPEVNQVVS